eukprot:TRINITY_DN9587_c2_g1_i1.p1 TRINITY_DN9587_c2_g1~~TRINITY_DN9587_c2_g1_i1.p1  ORF type:complete len:334 (+),score=93.02 TRINITY_DN9587_c2_g1_i1:81-1082(+)
MFDFIIGWISYIFYLHICTLATLMIISILTFLVPVIIQSFVFKDPNLKKRYPDAEWALVTGGSSGIGRALTETLAEQGFNVVIVALPDNLLTEIHSSLEEKYPNQKFIEIGVDLSNVDEACEEIFKETEGLDIDLLFSNAGYILVNLFSFSSIESQMKNYNVNSTIAVKLAHHFSKLMIQKKRKGAISFTSSPAGLMACPTSVMYGSTKAFLTNFGSSLAVELKPEGIDVLVLHPSPVDTNFYSGDSVADSSSLAFFKKTATPPTNIANTILCSLGKPMSVVRDQGYFSVLLKMLLKVIDSNFLSYVMAIFISMGGEYKSLREKGALQLEKSN